MNIICPNCHTPNDGDSTFCVNCGQSLAGSSQTNGTKKQGSGNKSVVIAVIIAGAALLIAIIIAVAIIFSGKKSSSAQGNPSHSAASVTTVCETTEMETEVATEAPTQAPTEAPTQAPTEAPTQAPVYTQPARDRLYKDKSKLCDQYTAYASGYSEGQGYAKLRYGPSKADYDIVGSMDNGTQITVESVSVNGWTMVYCHEKGLEGWMRTDFIYMYYYDCFENGGGYDPCEEGVGDKPVLYLYPEKETAVSVKVELSDDFRFTCTYPEYKNGWSVIAKPDGTLINKADGLEYSYLYWELGGKQSYDFSKGFVVKGSDTADFLCTTLSKMGLTPREYNEFIVYWLPKMQGNKYNLISFQTTAYTDNCELKISPKPDSLLRVFMAYKALDSYVTVEPQSFETFERKGFTAVEWGGAEVR